MTFTVGDLVKHKAGGPTMAVEIIAEDAVWIECSWFDGTKLIKGRFAPNVLTAAPSRDEGTGQVQSHDL